MRKLIAVLVILAILALLCQIVWVYQHNKLDSGYVVDKRFEAAHTIYTPIFIRVGAISIPQMIPNYYPDRWFITVQNGDKTDEWRVSNEDYNRLNIGDWTEKGVSH